MPHSVAPLPRMAVILPDTLACMGMKQLLLSIMPRVEVCLYGSLNELLNAGQDAYIHYFISSDVLLAHADFFRERVRQTFVLVHGTAPTVPAAFRTLNVCQPYADIVKALLRLEQCGHGPDKPQAALIRNVRPAEEPSLTPREKEVLCLVVKGYINKEIAERLHVSLTTVISHRKNLTEKLKNRSVSALTIYAVMHGLVRVEDI